METLVLDTTYQPLQSVPWQRAVVLLLQEKVEVVEEYVGRWVRSKSWSCMIPAVVRLITKAKKKHGLRFSRENVYTRDKGKCQYCLRKVTRAEATYDHVVPRRLGGQTRWNNVVICCVPCNQKKGGRTPEQAGMRSVEPEKPKHLPETLRLDMRPEQTPEEWKSYLVSVIYNHGELESD